MAARPRTIHIPVDPNEPPVVSGDAPRKRQSAAEYLAGLFKPQIAAFRAERSRRPLNTAEWMYIYGEQLLADLLDGTTGKTLWQQYVEKTGREISYSQFMLDLAALRRDKGMPAKLRPARRRRASSEPSSDS